MLQTAEVLEWLVSWHEQFAIFLHGIADFREADKLIGGVGAGRRARTIFKGREGHQRLVAQRGRAEGRAAESHGALHQGMSQFDAGGTEAGGARFNVAAHLPSDEFKQFLVGIALIGAHVHHEATGIRHDVVLRARLNLGDTHLHRSEQVGLKGEEVGAEPVYVGQCFVDGIDAFIAGSMSRFAVGGAVQDHQSFLCHGGLHLGGLADDGDIHLRQAGQGFLDAILAGHFLFGGGKENEIPRQFFTAQGEEDVEETDESAAAVVAAESEESVAFLRRGERVALPARHGFHGVNVGVEQDGSFVGREAGLFAPHVVTDALGRRTFLFQIVFQKIGTVVFFATERRTPNEFCKQRNGIASKKVKVGRFQNRSGGKDLSFVCHTVEEKRQTMTTVFFLPFQLLQK